VFQDGWGGKMELGANINWLEQSVSFDALSVHPACLKI
jgi:hypothetical protein